MVLSSCIFFSREYGNVNQEMKWNFEFLKNLRQKGDIYDLHQVGVRKLDSGEFNKLKIALLYKVSVTARFKVAECIGSLMSMTVSKGNDE